MKKISALCVMIILVLALSARFRGAARVVAGARRRRRRSCGFLRGGNSARAPLRHDQPGLRRERIKK